MKKVKSPEPTAKATRGLESARSRGAEPGRTTPAREAGGRTRNEKSAAARAGRKPTPPVKKKLRAAPNARTRSAAAAARSETGRGRTARSQTGRVLQIRELDPIRLCGGRTTVLKLFRVDEQAIGGKAATARQVHLVFNDRHGWYCEHGRSCHAVSAVMRHARSR